MPDTPQRLYHVSDRPGIKLFEPRESPRAAVKDAVVWAVDWEHLPNYLLPRDCPRVTFRAREDSDPEAVDRLLCGTSASRVIAIESCWLPRVLSERLSRYEFDPEGFEMVDETAGYYVSCEPARPLSVAQIADVASELLSFDIELRVMQSLWKLREAVIGSTLGFSIIRMRNAKPPVEGYDSWHPLP